MNAVKLLKQQHQDVRDLFELFDKARDATDKDRICQQLADNLAAHMMIEEQIFYPAAFRAMNDDARREESFAEHQEAKDILAEILDMDMSLGGQEFQQKIKLLQQKIEHHVQEEEDEVFKQARQVMDDDEMDRLGLEMKALFSEVMMGEPTETLMQGASVEGESESETQSGTQSTRM
jgi:hemerythrin-like domain-containing protein